MDPEPAHLLPLPWRLRIFSTMAALVPILTVYGVVSDSTAALWLGLIGAFLGGGAPAAAAVYTRQEIQAQRAATGGEVNKENTDG